MNNNENFAGFDLDSAVPENPDDVYEEPDNSHVGGHSRSTDGMGLDDLGSPRVPARTNSVRSTRSIEDEEFEPYGDDKYGKIPEAEAVVDRWWEDALAKGQTNNFYPEDDTTVSKKGKDIIVPVLHKFMQKFIEQDENEDLSLIGTFIQTSVGAQAAFSAKTAKDLREAGFEDAYDGVFDGAFKFRFNDVSEQPEQIELRRAVPVPGVGDKYTYNAKLPMKKKLLFALPPFEIIECEVLIEMSSTTTRDPKDNSVCQVRPNILASLKDERELLIIRDAAEINKTESYTMITESPFVEMEYDGGKEYCPKYKIVYYLERPAPFKITTTILPLIFVALLSTLNVFNPEDNGGPNLENAIGIALTVVFILPELRPTGVDKQPRISWLGGATSNDVLIALLFMGQIFSCIRMPEDALETIEYQESKRISKLGYAGVGLMWIAVILIPIWNYLKYRAIKKALQTSAMLSTSKTSSRGGGKAPPKRHAFVKKNKDGPNGGDLAAFSMWDPVSKDGKVNEEELANMVSCDTYLSRRNEKKVLGPWKVKKEMDKKKTNADGSQKLKKAWLYFGPEQNQRDEKGHDIPKQYSLSRMFSSSA